MALAQQNWQSTRNQLVTANRSIKSLAQKNWSGGSKAIEKAEQLRVTTVDAGKLYFSDTLPHTVDMVIRTKYLFKAISHRLEIDNEFSEIVPYILDIIIPLWQKTIRENENMMTSMKKATDEGNRMILELECLKKNNETKATSLRGKASTKDKWGIALCFILPFIGFVPAYFCWKSADHNRSEASQQEALARKHAVTSRNVAQDLIPVAKSCTSLAKYVAGFLEEYKAMFQQINRNGEGGFRRHHIIKIKRKAIEVVDACENVEHELPTELITSLSF